MAWVDWLVCWIGPRCALGHDTYLGPKIRKQAEAECQAALSARGIGPDCSDFGYFRNLGCPKIAVLIRNHSSSLHFSGGRWHNGGGRMDRVALPTVRRTA